MAVSLRDYFIRFLYKTDKAGAKDVENTNTKLAKGFDHAGARALAFNEKIEAIKHILEPFHQLKELVNGVAEDADNLQDLSERTGIATKRLEELGYMAKLSGTNLETMTTGLRILEKNMGEAAAGGKEQGEAFAKLGIQLHGANGKMKTADELLPELSKSFEHIHGHANKTAMAMKLFGRSGQELLPFLEQGPDAIKAMNKELELLGGVTSEEFLSTSKEYVDTLKKVEMIMKGMKQALLLPLIKMFLESNQKMIQFVKVSGQIVRNKLAEWGQQVVTSFKALKQLVIDFAPLLITLAAAFNAPLLAMIGIKALLALLIDDFANWRKGNDSVIGHIIEHWDEWMDRVRKSSPLLAEFLNLAKTGLKGIYSVLLMIENVLESIVQGNFLKELREIGNTAARYYGLTGQRREEGTVIGATTLDPATGKVVSTGREDYGRDRGQLVERNGAPVVNNNMQLSVQVNAPSGTVLDERKLAQEMKRVWDEETESQIRNGYNVLVPEMF